MKVGYLYQGFREILSSPDEGITVHIKEFTNALVKKGIEVFIICANKGDGEPERHIKVFEIKPFSILNTVRKIYKLAFGGDTFPANPYPRLWRGKNMKKNNSSCSHLLARNNRKIGNFLSECDRILYNFRFFRKASKIIKKQQPDMLYERYPPFSYAYASSKLAKKFHIPLFLELNGLECFKADKSELYFKDLASRIQEKVFRNADIIVIVAQAIKQHLTKLSISDKKIHTISNGVNINKFTPSVNGLDICKKYRIERKIVVGFIGGLRREYYDFELLLDAMSEVAKEDTNIHLLIVGDGPDRNFLEEYTNELNIRKHVTFTGNIPHNEINKYIGAMDIAVALFNPQYECSAFYDSGSPLKIFEYMSMGKPTIVSHMGEETREMIRHNENAILIEPAKEQLQKAILKLVGDKELRDKLGSEARKTIEQGNYTWERNVDSVCEIYDSINIPKS